MTIKGPQNDQKRPENDQNALQKDTQNINKTSLEIQKDTQNINKTSLEIQKDTQNINNINLEIQRDTQNINNNHNNHNNHNNNVNNDKTWSCYFCLKTFTTNCSMNRHMRLYCKVKKYHSDRIKELEEQNRQLQNKLLQQDGTNHHNINNSNNSNYINNTTTNNITNNNQFNITLPEGTWCRNLWAVMIHLISKTKGDRFTKGELEFNDAFGKTLSVAFHHPDSPLYNSIEMLGRKEGWAKHNGKVVQKQKLLKRINKQHLERLIQFIYEDNERFRRDMPPVPVIEKWIEVNDEIIKHIKKYDPCDIHTLRESEEVFRNQTLIKEFNNLVYEVKKNESMDKTIAFGQQREQKRRW
jgi:hypothetical protein